MPSRLHTMVTVATISISCTYHMSASLGYLDDLNELSEQAYKVSTNMILFKQVRKLRPRRLNDFSRVTLLVGRGEGNPARCCWPQCAITWAGGHTHFQAVPRDVKVLIGWKQSRARGSQVHCRNDSNCPFHSLSLPSTLPHSFHSTSHPFILQNMRTFWNLLGGNLTKSPRPREAWDQIAPSHHSIWGPWGSGPA